MIPKTVAALDAGNPPDVAYGDVYDFQVTAKWAYEGKLEDVSSIIDPLQRQVRAARAVDDLPLQRPDQERAYYAYPIKQQTMHIQYWKDMLAEAGFKESDIPTDWKGTGASGATRCSRPTARRPATAPSASAADGRGLERLVLSRS